MYYERTHTYGSVWHFLKQKSCFYCAL